jgi:hypothetical protein
VRHRRSRDIDTQLAHRIAAQISSPRDRGHDNYVVAELFAKQGDIERSIEFLRKAKELGYSHMNDVSNDAEFAFVRVDPRFRGAMVEQQGK